MWSAAELRWWWTLVLVACSPPARPTRALEPAWTPPATAIPIGPALAVTGDRPTRCSIRITGDTIMVDGDPMKRSQVIALCKQRKEALLEVADDASKLEWRKLRDELAAAGVTILLRGTTGDETCQNNPLARCN